MENAGSEQPVCPLVPPPYLGELARFLRQSDAAVWKWFASQRTTAKYAEDVRFELLKSTYRVERASQPALYEAAEGVARQLGLTAALTIYQAQNPEGLNASLVYAPGEAHLVLHGPLADRLSAIELRGLMAHELAHYLLWSRDDGELHTASEVLLALVNDAHSHPAHFASWRLFRLYAEIFCDRASLAVTGDMLAVVGMLVKVTTGVTEVSPDAYLRQADEILARETKAADATHPETFIRARAVRLWAERDPAAEAHVRRMIEGQPGMDELDLLEQTRVATLTRRVLDLLLCRKWFVTDPVLAHAWLYFDDYVPPTSLVTDDKLASEIRVEPDSLRDYYAYLLLDFLSADRDRDEPAVAAALTVAAQIGIKARFLELCRLELKLRKNQLDRIDREAESLLRSAVGRGMEAKE